MRSSSSSSSRTNPLLQRHQLVTHLPNIPRALNRRQLREIDDAIRAWNTAMPAARNLGLLEAKGVRLLVLSGLMSASDLTNVLQVPVGPSVIVTRVGNRYINPSVPPYNRLFYATVYEMGNMGLALTKIASPAWQRTTGLEAFLPIAAALPYIARHPTITNQYLSNVARLSRQRLTRARQISSRAGQELVYIPRITIHIANQLHAIFQGGADESSERGSDPALRERQYEQRFVWRFVSARGDNPDSDTEDATDTNDTNHHRATFPIHAEHFDDLADSRSSTEQLEAELLPGSNCKRKQVLDFHKSVWELEYGPWRLKKQERNKCTIIALNEALDGKLKQRYVHQGHGHDWIRQVQIDYCGLEPNSMPGNYDIGFPVSELPDRFIEFGGLDKYPLGLQIMYMSRAGNYDPGSLKAVADKHLALLVQDGQHVCFVQNIYCQGEATSSQRFFFKSREERSERGLLFYDFETYPDNQLRIEGRHVVDDDTGEVTMVGGGMPLRDCICCCTYTLHKSSEVRHLTFRTIRREDGSYYTSGRQLLDWLKDPIATHNTLFDCYAHNGSGFDIYFLYTQLTDTEMDYFLDTKHSDLVRVRFNIIKMAYNGHVFLDSFKFLVCGLEKLCKSFLPKLEHMWKTTAVKFHDPLCGGVITDPLEGLPVITTTSTAMCFYGHDNDTPFDVFLEWVHDTSSAMSFGTVYEDYCRRDVDCLQMIWDIYRKTSANIAETYYHRLTRNVTSTRKSKLPSRDWFMAKLDPRKSLTLGMLQMQTLKAINAGNPKWKLANQACRGYTNEQREFLRSYKIGGMSCCLMPGIVDAKISCFDVCSLYPASQIHMATCGGKMQWIDMTLLLGTEAYETMDSKIRNCEIPFLGMVEDLRFKEFDEHGNVYPQDVELRPFLELDEDNLRYVRDTLGLPKNDRTYYSKRAILRRTMTSNIGLHYMTKRMDLESYNIVKGFIWPEWILGRDIFGLYVDVLSGIKQDQDKLKQAKDPACNPALRELAKLAINASTGKLGQELKNQRKTSILRHDEGQDEVHVIGPHKIPRTVTILDESMDESTDDLVTDDNGYNDVIVEKQDHGEEDEESDEDIDLSIHSDLDPFSDVAEYADEMQNKGEPHHHPNNANDEEQKMEEKPIAALKKRQKGAPMVVHLCFLYEHSKLQMMEYIRHSKYPQTYRDGSRKLLPIACIETDSIHLVDNHDCRAFQNRVMHEQATQPFEITLGDPYEKNMDCETINLFPHTRVHIIPKSLADHLGELVLEKVAHQGLYVGKKKYALRVVIPNDDEAGWQLKMSGLKLWHTLATGVKCDLLNFKHYVECIRRGVEARREYEEGVRQRTPSLEMDTWTYEQRKDEEDLLTRKRKFTQRPRMLTKQFRDQAIVQTVVEKSLVPYVNYMWYHGTAIVKPVHHWQSICAALESCLANESYATFHDFEFPSNLPAP